MRTGIAATAFALVIAAHTGVSGQAPQESAAPATEREKLTFDGDVALWTVAIKPDKTADFERVMQRLREALMNSDDPQRRAQGKGWKVMRMGKPLPDGNIAYVHVISPVVRGADYTIMQTLYDELADERQQLYELYRGAFVRNLGLGIGDVAVDMATASPSTSPAAIAAR
jgi:hypothetical protein